jgi:hypothetical protein
LKNETFAILTVEVEEKPNEFLSMSACQKRLTAAVDSRNN